MDQQPKRQQKHFGVMLDTELRKQIRLNAMQHDMTVMDLVERAFRLVVEAGGVEELENLYHERKGKK